MIINRNIFERVSDDDIDLSSFDIKSSLNDKIWNGDKMNLRVRRNLLVIAKDFVESLSIDKVEIEDIVLTGSLANYNWDETYSDIDLHIIIDFSKFCKNTKIIKGYFDELRKNWNKNHDDISICGYPVELYVQDVDEVHKSSGVYSVLNDEWIRKPSLKKINGSEFDEDDVKSSVADFENKIDEIMEDFNDCRSRDDFENLYDRADELFDEIKKTRQRGMKQKNPEMSDGNIIFKSLRRFGYIGKLLSIRTKCYDAIVSID